MSKSTVQTDAERTPIMQRLLFFIVILLSGSCDALWGYTKIPTLEENCLAGDTVCKSYEVCSPETERCVQAVPQLTAVSPRVVFFDGGDVVTLTGDGFAPASQVFIDDQAVVVMPVSSAQSLTAKIPKRPGIQNGETRPVKVEIRVADKSVARLDLLSLVSSEASFSNSFVTGITAVGNIGNIQIGDVNNDGRVDLVARSAYFNSAGPSDYEFYTSLGNGDGTFRKSVKSATGSISVGYFVLCDLNSDSKLDLVYWSNIPRLFQYSINPGTGVFPAQATFLMPNPALTNPYLGIADLDGNTSSDLYIVDNSSNNRTMLSILANGSGALVPPATPKTGVVLNPENSVPLISDFNRDQKPDLLSYSSISEPAVYLGNGIGGFGQGTPYAGSSKISEIAVADFDGDGYSDFVTSSNNSKELVLFRNLKGQGFDSIHIPNPSISAIFILATDLNGDKNADILVFESGVSSPSGYAFMGYGNGQFSLPTQSVRTSFPSVVVSKVADLNADGKLDMAFINYNDQNAYIIMNTLK